MYLAIIILPLLGLIFSGVFLMLGIDLLVCTNLLTSFTLFVIVLSENITDFLNLEYAYSNSPYIGIDQDDLIHFPLDSYTHYLDEKNLLENGVADSREARIRDEAISNGIDPSVSYQPYARNLANKLDIDRDGSSNIPDTILTKDREFIQRAATRCWDNYNPNMHYLNSRTMRAYLNSLH